MKRYLFLLIILSLVVISNLATPGIMDAHDAPDHVARIANFYQSLTEGIGIPRWAGNLNWGYGHPILMFLYPLPSYMASLFHAVGFSIVDSVKLVFGVSYLFSIIAFFLWAGNVWGPFAAFVGAVLYGFAPYRFVDLYVRGAIGEHVAFIFPPVIFMGLWTLAQGRRYTGDLLVALGMAGLLLSHNAVSLMILPIAFLYILYLSFSQAKRKRMFWVHTCVSIATGFALSAFFWVPAFFEGKYTLRDIVTKGDFANRFVSFRDFIYSPWSYGGTNYLTKEIGIAQWIAVLFAAFLVLRTKKREVKRILIALLCIFAASLVIQTQWSAWLWHIVALIQKFQFPWRFLTVSVLTTAILGSVTIAHVSNRKYIVGWALVILAVVTTMHMWKAKSYSQRAPSYYWGVYDSTTDTGESSPIWSVRFMEHRPVSRIEVIDGDARISEEKRTTTLHEYDIDAATQTRVVENTLYFPGWNVYIDGRNSDIEFQDPQYRGLMTFIVPAGEHSVRIEFSDTKLRTAANVISVVGLFVIVGVGTIRLWSRKRRPSQLH